MLMDAIIRRRRLARFNPATLFGTTDTGWLYDLSDMSTLFQDAAGTTPVTAVGQPVGLQLDKSGRGNHRSQSVSLNRPTLRQDTNGLYYLEYDGLNDSLSTAPFAWGSDKATICAGVRDSSLTIVQQSIVEFSTGTGDGRFLLHRGVDAPNRTLFQSRGTLAGSAGSSNPIQPATLVATGIGDISGDRANLRVNGIQVAQATTDQGTGNFGTHAAFFGARAGTSLFFNGREYSNVGINRLLTANELTQIERYTAQRTGVTLP